MRAWGIAIVIFVAVFGTAGWFIFQKPGSFASAPQTWSPLIEPGKLSKFHSNIEKNCNECHAPYGGVERDQCVVCHSAQTELLKKQNTAFHGTITSCTGCHFEHQGKDASITKMDHTHFALVAKEVLEKAPLKQGDSERGFLFFLQSTSKKAYHGSDLVLENNLNCASCHANQDRHRSLFGSDCSSCHETAKWSLVSFRHPSPASHDCSQCHQAPPSHYMMHFKMISEKVAGVEHAQVNQCYRCHQTTVWNDIKGVGWYKHH